MTKIVQLQKNPHMTSISSVTGNWRLSLTKSTPQNEFLGAMGRMYWERVCIDKADENFWLLHFLKPMPNNVPSIHYFEKYVTIYLKMSVLSILAKLLSIEFDKVQYSHKLIGNNKEKQHPDDEKRFGPCSSRTTWEKIDNREGMVIRWYVPKCKGLLKVFHFVNDVGDLQVEMEFSDNLGKITKAIKIYERLPFTDAQQAQLEKMTYKAELLPSK